MDHHQMATMTNQPLAQADRIKWTAFKYLLLAFGFYCLVVVYYFAFCRIPRTSDDASVFLSGYDMSQGNWKLAGWWTTDDNFLTLDAFLYAIMIKCLGLNPNIMFYLAAIVWAVLALLSVNLAQAGLARSERAVAVAAVSTPILLPIFKDNGGMNLITHAPMHITTIIYVLVTFILVKKIFSRQIGRSKLLLIGYGLLMCITIFGDPIAIFIGAMPVCVVAGFSFLRGGEWHPRLAVLIITILDVVIARFLIGLNSRTGGFEIVLTQEMRFVPFSELGKNLGMVIHYFFVLFGCDFFGKDALASLVNGAALALIRLPFLGLLVFALVKTGQKFFVTAYHRDHGWPLVESDYLDALLAVGFVLCVLSAALSTRIIDMTTVRYFFPALAFGAILIARLPSNTRLHGLYIYFALGASILFCGLGFASDRGRRLLLPPNIKAVSNWLSKNDLHDGFGPYWSSAIITAATKNRVRVRALILGGRGILEPFRWQASKAWYRRDAVNGTGPVFVLADQADTLFYNEKDVIRTLGEPQIKQQVGSYLVNVYDSQNKELQALFLAPPPVH
jgi:hypothetical protein